MGRFLWRTFGTKMAQPSVQEAVAILLQNEAVIFRLASETLFKIVRNLLTQPDEPRNYRRVCLNAPIATGTAVASL